MARHDRVRYYPVITKRGMANIPVIAIALLVWAAGTAPALAHGGGGDVAAGFAGRFLDPLFAPDHVAGAGAIFLRAALSS